MPDAKEYNLEAFYLAKGINLAKVAEKLDKNLVGRRREFLTYLLGPNEYLFIFSFGAVVFTNIAKETQTGIKRSLSKFLIEPVKRDYDEAYDLYERGEEIKEISVGPDSANLPAVGIEEIEIVSRILAQSVALDYVEDLADEMLTNVENMNSQLEKTGRFFKGEKAILQLFAQNNSIIQFVVSKLSLLDKPEITWEKTSLETLFLQLADMYELSPRFRSMEYKINFVRDNSEFALSTLQTSRATFVEILIVILILVEILLYFFGKG